MNKTIPETKEPAERLTFNRWWCRYRSLASGEHGLSLRDRGRGNPDPGTGA